MTDLHYHACPVCYAHAPCRMDCHIEPDLSGDRPTGHTTPCDDCSKPAPIAVSDLPAALRGYAGDGSIEPVDAPASLLLRAADALDEAAARIKALDIVVLDYSRALERCEGDLLAELGEMRDERDTLLEELEELRYDRKPPVAEAHVGGLWLVAYAAPCGGLDVVAYSSPRLAQCPFAARWRDGRWRGVVGSLGGRETKRAVERWVTGVSNGQ